MTRNRSSAGVRYGVTMIDVVDCLFPQPFVAVRVIVSVPSKCAAEYITEMVPLLEPLPGETPFPSDDEKDQLVAFATVKVMVAVPPSPMLPGDTLSPVMLGSGFIGMITELEFVQPLAFVTVTLSVTGPAEAVSKVMPLVPWPLSMIALFTVQAYVEPGPPKGMDAV